MSGAEELARYFLITLTFVAASYVTQRGRPDPHGGVPGPASRRSRAGGCSSASSCAASRCSACCASPAVITIRNNLQNQTATLEMPFWLFMAPLAVGSALLVVETAAHARAHVAAHAAGREADGAHLKADARWKASSSSSPSWRCSCWASRSCSRSAFRASSTSSPTACRSTSSRSARSTRSTRFRWSRCRCSCSSAAS